MSTPLISPIEPSFAAFSEKLIERHSSLTFRREVVLLGRVCGMPVPQPSFAITSENAGTVQHQRIAAKLLLGEAK